MDNMLYEPVHSLRLKMRGEFELDVAKCFTFSSSLDMQWRNFEINLDQLKVTKLNFYLIIYYFFSYQQILECGFYLHYEKIEKLYYSSGKVEFFINYSESKKSAQTL